MLEIKLLKSNFCANLITHIVHWHNWKRSSRQGIANEEIVTPS